MPGSSASGRAHERDARRSPEDRAARGARRERRGHGPPGRADGAYSRVRGRVRRGAGGRGREALRAGRGGGGVRPGGGEPRAARVGPRRVRSRLPRRLLPGAQARAVRGRRRVSDPSEALASAKAAADRIVKVKRLNACLTPIKELRKSLAAQASTAHPSGVLYGMPVAVKDNICTLEFTTSCGSKILEGYRSPYDATAVAKLKAAGGGIIGKKNCDEVGMGSSPEHSAYGRSLPPFHKTRVAGGSSGGSGGAPPPRSRAPPPP